MRIPGLGFLRFHLLTRPADALDRYIGRRRLPALAASIHRLPPLPAPDRRPRPDRAITYLTGDRFLYQTVFSLHSLLRVCEPDAVIRIISDGTLSAESRTLLERLFPGWLEIDDDANADARIDRLFPRDRFPELRRGRDEGALYRKLLDAHGGRRGWTLFIDSDTYFHRRPEHLLALLAAGDRSVHMIDQWSNYGHPPDRISSIAGFRVPPLINSGLTGMRSESIDWPRLESWLAALRAHPGGRSVFFEQGLTAMLLSARPDTVALPAADYALSPSSRETRAPSALFHHYAGNSKYRFIRHQVPAPLFGPAPAPSPFGSIKHLLFGRGLRVRRILLGPARGLRMELDPAAKSQRLLGLDEREIQPDFVAFSRWADTLVDVGASDGYYGLIFRKLNPDGAVHLIDGAPDFAALQRRHFALNFPAGNTDIRTAFVTAPERQGPGTCLLSRDLPLAGRRVFFKIDVDGWEMEVLRSAETVLVSTACRLVVETHSPQLERECAAFLEALGYRVTIIPNAWWRRVVPELRPLAQNRWLSAVRP